MMSDVGTQMRMRPFGPLLSAKTVGSLRVIAASQPAQRDWASSSVLSESQNTKSQEPRRAKKHEQPNITNYMQTRKHATALKMQRK